MAKGVYNSYKEIYQQGDGDWEYQVPGVTFKLYVISHYDQTNAQVVLPCNIAPIFLTVQNL